MGEVPGGRRWRFAPARCASARRGCGTEDLIKRFVQERSILARLEHPACRLIDAGVGGEGLPYLVMEYV